MRIFGKKTLYALAFTACLSLLPFLTGAEEEPSAPAEEPALSAAGTIYDPSEESPDTKEVTLPADTEEAALPAVPEDTADTEEALPEDTGAETSPEETAETEETEETEGSEETLPEETEEDSAEAPENGENAAAPGSDEPEEDPEEDPGETPPETPEEPLEEVPETVPEAPSEETPETVPEAPSVETPEETPESGEDEEEDLPEDGPRPEETEDIPEEQPEEEAAFACGETMFWSVSEDGTELVITGSGDMFGFTEADEAPWSAHKETVVSVVLPKELTSVGDLAFSGFTALKEITLPAGVTSVGARAFENCTALVSITFSGECPVFGEDVFKGDTLTVYHPASDTWAEVPAFGEGIAVTAYGGEEEEPEEDVPEEEPFFPEIRLNEERIRLAVGERFTLTAETNFAPEKEITWSVEGDAVSVSEGVVTAEGYGTAYITARASFGGAEYVSVCTAEVPRTAPVSTGVSDVRLITASATVEIFRTDYATVRILPVLSIALSPDSDTGNVDMSAAAVEKAVFTNGELNELFTLRVKDGETLEIVPTELALRLAAEKKTKLKSTYVTGLTVTAGGTEFTPYESLKLKIRRSKPSLKAEPLVFNSYPAELGKLVPISFKGGTVISCALENEPPAWLMFDAGQMSAGLSADYIPDKYSSGKLVLTCEVEGWAVPAKVTVKYSGKNIEPKLSFPEKSVTLFADTGDTARLKYKLGPAAYAGHTVTLKGVEEKNGSKYTPVRNGALIKAELKGDELVLSAPEPAPDKKEHVYRVVLTALDKEFYFSVRVMAAGTVPKPSLRTAGSIDSGEAGSAFTIASVKKNFHMNSPETYALTAIEQYKGKTLVNPDVRELFSVTEKDGRFLLRESAPGSVPAGYTYRAVITLTTVAGEASSRVTVKISAAPGTAEVKAALAAEGSISVSDPSSGILLTPSVRPKKKEEELSLVFFKRKDGKSVELEADECPFTVRRNADGTYTLRLSGKIEAGTLYYAQLRVQSGGKTYASKTVKLSVKR